MISTTKKNTFDQSHGQDLIKQPLVTLTMDWQEVWQKNVATARARPSGDHLVGQDCGGAHEDEEGDDHGGDDDER